MYNVSLTDFHRERFKPIFEQVERACQQTGIDFYLVGAVARDIAMAIHGLESTRVTRDLDLAVLIPDEADYQRLKNVLLDQGNFAEVRDMPFTLKYAGLTDVDLLPFGGMELTNTPMLNRGEGVARLSVTGFTEVYNFGTQLVTLDDQFTFRVCSLPGMVLLKLIAYDDRPEHRLKDLTDVSFILKNYLDIAEEDLYDHHYDLLETSVSLALTAARLLGRHISPLLATSPPLRERLTDILDRAIAAGPGGVVIRQLQTAQFRADPLDHVLNLVQHLRQGLNDPLTTNN
ncbi:nucleotidyl transferase AbiEii/AbiGii toxin family protein [uncultured Fibrella sp.]|uniref:nucleotidyl transferase AbiEii/AbiGii toxin family protein n=1 Tax=uncultured Fibrella sp. TaxID=1284596 RepID=UPI0035CCA6CD